MGGRIATQVAAADASLPVAGLVLLGYPSSARTAHKLRDAHLPDQVADALRQGAATRSARPASSRRFWKLA
jgi:predicted alpha/beta-hydrolase family hydrolase